MNKGIIYLKSNILASALASLGIIFIFAIFFCFGLAAGIGAGQRDKLEKSLSIEKIESRLCEIEKRLEKKK
jgi:hypothetical protein